MTRGDLVNVAIQGEHGKPRPALVIMSDDFAQYTKTGTVALLTTAPYHRHLDIRIPIEPSRTNGLRHRSYIMIDRIYSVKPSRIAGVIGFVDDAVLVKVAFGVSKFWGIV